MKKRLNKNQKTILRETASEMLEFSKKHNNRGVAWLSDFDAERLIRLFNEEFTNRVAIAANEEFTSVFVDNQGVEHLNANINAPALVGNIAEALEKVWLEHFS